MNNKSILVFDCAGSGAGISLRVGDVTFTETLPQGKQAMSLVSKINEVVKKAGIPYADIGEILTTIGPGSFTGLRIGLAALHGLVLVHKTPIKTITTLESFAWQVASNPAAPASYYVAIRAGKGEVYVQAFTQSAGHPTATGDIFLAPETRTEWDLPFYSNHLPATDANYIPAIDTALLCNVAQHLPLASLAEALPLYIRPPDAIIPKTASWLTK